MKSIVIVGAGQAAVEAAAALRTHGFEGRLRIAGDEREGPYQRPPLSKGFLNGSVGADKIRLRSPEFFAGRNIELMPAARAAGIDLAAARIRLDSGEEWPYDRLLIATGSRPRPLELEGAGLAGVHYLRSLADARALRTRLTPGARLAVIGGGYIGLEVAATARGRGCEVVVAEIADTLMARQVGPELAEYFRRRHQREGVDVRTGCRVSALEGRDRVEAIVLDGRPVPVDAVVVGVGILPNVDWLAGSGLASARGLPVDSHCRAGAAGVFGAGDVTVQRLENGVQMRIESVQNAVYQGRAAALSMLERPPAPAVPWFWSDQYELKLQMAGIAGRDDAVVQRRADGWRSTVYLRGDIVSAVHVVGNSREFMAAKKLIQQQTPVDTARLADPEVALKELLK